MDLDVIVPKTWPCEPYGSFSHPRLGSVSMWTLSHPRQTLVNTWKHITPKTLPCEPNESAFVRSCRGRK